MAIRLAPLGEGPPIPLDRPIVFIGRHADCDVRIDSKKISRRHCCIVQLHHKLVIRDLGSTNGIYFNGQRVDEAVLVLQDEVQIANLRYQVLKVETGPIPACVPRVEAAPLADRSAEQEIAGHGGAGRKPTQEIPNQ